MTGSGVDEIFGRLTGVDHEAILPSLRISTIVHQRFLQQNEKTYGEFHALRPSSPQLPRNHHLAPFRTAFHDETQHAVARSSDRQSVEQFVAQGFALRDGGEAAVLHLGGIEGDGVLGELEAFLDEGGQFADAAALLAEDFLGVCCADDYELVRIKMITRIVAREEMGLEINRWGASVLISVTVGVTRTSTPEYPSSASSRWKNSFSSA